MSTSEFGGLGLSIEPVRGVRSFRVDTLGRLTGVTFAQVWTPGENQATCRRGQDALSSGMISASLSTIFGLSSPPAAAAGGVMSPRMAASSEAPIEQHDMGKCGCGFYAYYDGSNDYRSDARVSAVVEGYGETVIGTRGFRAGKARVLALCVPDVRRKKAPGRLHRALHWIDSRAWAGVVFGLLLTLTIVGVLAQFSERASVGARLGVLALAAVALPLVVLGWRSLGINARCCTPTARRRGGPLFMFATPEEAAPLTAAQVDRVRRNYPDVPFYTDFAAMIRDFPPDRGHEPTPATDPDFWTRSAS